MLAVETWDAIARLRRNVAMLAIAAVLALTGLGFLVGAGYIATARRIGDLEATVAFGAGFLFVAVVLLIVQRLAAASAARQAARRRRREASNAATAATAAFLGTKGGVVSALGASLAAGFLVSFLRSRKSRSEDD